MGQTKTKLIDNTEANEKVEAKKATKEKTQFVRGKNYLSAKSQIDKNKFYNFSDAIKILREINKAKFDATIEIHLITKKESVSINVSLPHGTGKEKKIEIANDDTIKALETGKINFDVLLATPEFMPKLVRFAKILGPKGLMPNPKNGTVIKSEKEASKFSANSLNIKTERKAPIIHTTIGKISMEDKKLEDNLNAIIEALGGNKQIVKVYICASMSPSIKLNI